MHPIRYERSGGTSVLFAREKSREIDDTGNVKDDGTESAKPKLKPVYEYSDYRVYLRDYFAYSKASKKGFSYRVFARVCGFKSSNFLMLVMNGKSSLTSISVEKVIRGIKMNRDEAQFFRQLVAFTDAKTPTQRMAYAQEIMSSRNVRQIYPLLEAQYRYLGTWYLPVIRSVVGLEDFKPDPQWIGQRLFPAVSAEEVEQALNQMLALGLLKKDESGRFVQAERMLATPPEIASSFAAQYHLQMLARASESIDRFKREQRHLVGATVALDDEAFARVKELAEKFRNDVMELASQSSHAKAIYQVNLQAFPLFSVLAKKTEES